MSTHSSPVLGTHSPVSFDHNRPVSHSRFYYSSVPGPQRPPAVYASNVRRQSETQRTDATRVQSSVSSAESGSSGMSALKGHYSPQTYWHASSMEQGLADEFNEKSHSGWHSPVYKPAQTHTRPDMAEDNSAVMRYIQQQHKLEEPDEDDNDHAIWVLFWLSCLDPIHSVISAAYTLLVILTLALVSPIRICRKQSSFGDQIIRILAPLFRNHLEMMYAESVENAFEFDFKPACLVVVHLSTPFLSFGVMVASWISAAFWLFSRVMGNPDGSEGRDDGRDTVIQVRNWWEKYLLNAIKQ